MPGKVLFVCMGNICRSPAAEGVLLAEVEKAGLQDQVTVDSAGTTGYHIGERADHRMRAAASRRSYDLQSRARKVSRDDLTNFDLVIAMDKDNLSHLQKLPPQPTARVCLFHDFLSDDWPEEVPDPYYGCDDGFEFVLDMLEAGCPNILHWLDTRDA